MTKQEFLENLRRSLSGGLDYRAVDEHILYYSDYIDSQIRQGVAEEEVMATLGEPRLIAKTLLGMEGAETVTEEYVDEDTANHAGERYFNLNGKSFYLPEWLITIVTVVIAFFVLTIVFAFMAILIRPLLVILAVVFCYKCLKNLFR